MSLQNQQILFNQIKKLNKEKLNICEVGCGSGEIITSLAKEFPNNLYYATDINPQAISDTQKLAKQRNVGLNVKEGNFLEPLKNQLFDIIFFNTPYLPCEEGDRFNKLSIEDRAIYGGRIGCEVTNSFIDSLHDFLHEKTKIYILISSLTQPKLVEENLKNNGFEFEVVAKESHFFEELLIYKNQSNEVLKHLLQNNYTNIKRFDKGKHSYIMQAKDTNSNTVMIKFGKREYISKEIYYLKKLQDTQYAPQIVEVGYNFVIYKKVEGLTIEKFLEHCRLNKYSLEEIEFIFNRVFEICYDLDKRGICKDEMTHPNEHIHINTDKLDEIHFIDFERSSMSNRFENTRQFLQFVSKCSFIFEKFEKAINRGKIISIGKDVDKLHINHLIMEDLYKY